MSVQSRSPRWAARLALSSLAFATVSLRAQTKPGGVIDGVVSDSNLVSLSNATASILGTPIHVATGANGRFRITGLHTGEYIVVVHRLGYVATSAAIQLSERDTLRMSFALEPIATALDTVSVIAERYSARMSEFEARRKTGFGHFITAADIDKRNSVFLADVLRTELSVGITEDIRSQRAVNMRGMSNLLGGPCEFQVYVDHVLMTPPVNLLDLPLPSQIAGIEIYSGPATIPLQYKTTHGSFCGAILMWTKDGF